MEGFSFWIKIEGVRLELNGKNSIYRSRKTVCLFTINCDCTVIEMWVLIHTKISNKFTMQKFELVAFKNSKLCSVKPSNNLSE